MQYPAGSEAFFYRKLKAGKIFPWTLTFEQGKGILLLSDDLRGFLGYPNNDVPLEWDTFVEAHVHPDSRSALFHEAVKASRDPDYSIFLECRVWSKKTESWHWVLPFGNADEIDPIKDYARLSGGLQDIQDRMEAMRLRELEQAELQRERSRLNTIIGAASLGTWDWDLLTDEVTYNKTWADIVGLSLEDIQGSVDAWEKTVLPEDLPLAMEAVEAHCRGETPMYEAEFRMRRGDGTIIWGIDRGRVVEVGPHDELMEKKGAYWRLYEAQVRRVDAQDLEDLGLMSIAPAVVAPHSEHPAGQA